MIPVQSGTTPTKINIGCGYDRKAGYLNVDSDADVKPDVLLVDNDFSRLPQGYFEEVYAKDVLEHIPRAAMAGALFDWAQLLRPGGRMFVQTSYIYGIIDVMRRRNDFETIHNWKVCLFGNQAHPGDWHFNGFTDITLRVYLAAAGIESDRFDIDDGWLISTTGIKRNDWHSLTEMMSYDEFVTAAHLELLGRPPEPFKLLGRQGSKAGTRERLMEVKALVGSAERFYYLGRALGASTIPLNFRS